jgi:hypothetical protein
VKRATQKQIPEDFPRSEPRGSELHRDRSSSFIFSKGERMTDEGRREKRRAYRNSHRDEIRAYNRAYQNSHKEEIKAYKRAYRSIHGEERKTYDREKAKAYYASYREERKAYQETYYAANREKRIAYQKAYAAAHPEKRLASKKAYYAAHREKIRAKAKAYQRRYDESHRDQKRAYRAAHREEITAYRKKYRGPYNAALRGEWEKIISDQGKDFCIKCGKRDGKIDLLRLIPGGKEIGFSKKMRVTPDRLKELSKCIALCRSCHMRSMQILKQDGRAIIPNSRR